jgi:hypothetical protein
MPRGAGFGRHRQEVEAAFRRFEEVGADGLTEQEWVWIELRYRETDARWNEQDMRRHGKIRDGLDRLRL